MKNTDYLNELCYYILELSSYGGEPLYIVIGSPLDDEIGKLEEIADCLILLYEKGYIKVKWHSLYGDAKFIPVENLQLQDIIEYIERNRASGFNGYPKEGGEYFIETTESGYEKVPEDYTLPGWED